MLEVGAGIGSITQRYANGHLVTATDVSPECVSAMEERFADSPNVTVMRTDLRGGDDGLEGFDSVVMINVLEHIQTSRGARAAR